MTQQLPRRKLGNTGLEVASLSLGGLPLARRIAKGATPDILRHAAAYGINLVDSAPSYYDSEVTIGEALREVDAEFIIGTKMGNLPPQDYKTQDPAFLRKSLEESFAHFGRDYIDILYIHEADRPDLHDWWVDKDTYQGPVLDLLREYKEKGRIGFIGLGGTTTTEMARLIRSGKFDIVLTAFEYSLLWQEAKYDVLPAAKSAGMGILAGSPLQQGALTRIFWHDVVEKPMRWLSTPRRLQFKRLYEFIQDSGMPITEMAMRFVLSNPDIHTILTGVKSVAELETNVEAIMKGPLPPDMLKEIDDIYNMVPFRPFGEPFSPHFQVQFDEAEKKYTPEELEASRKRSEEVERWEREERARFAAQGTRI